VQVRAGGGAGRHDRRRPSRITSAIAKKLLTELLRHGGTPAPKPRSRTVRRGMARPPRRFSSNLSSSLEALYRRGYGELAVALHAAGMARPWGAACSIRSSLPSTGFGLRGSSLDDTRLAGRGPPPGDGDGGPLRGASFRRSAGLTGTPANQSTTNVLWWARQLHLALGIEPARQGGRAGPSRTAPDHAM